MVTEETTQLTLQRKSILPIEKSYGDKVFVYQDNSLPTITVLKKLNDKSEDKNDMRHSGDNLFSDDELDEIDYTTIQLQSNTNAYVIKPRSCLKYKYNIQDVYDGDDEGEEENDDFYKSYDKSSQAVITRKQKKDKVPIMRCAFDKHDYRHKSNSFTETSRCQSVERSFIGTNIFPCNNNDYACFNVIAHHHISESELDNQANLSGITNTILHRSSSSSSILSLFNLSSNQSDISPLLEYSNDTFDNKYGDQDILLITNRNASNNFSREFNSGDTKNKQSEINKISARRINEISKWKTENLRYKSWKYKEKHNAREEISGKNSKRLNFFRNLLYSGKFKKGKANIDEREKVVNKEKPIELVEHSRLNNNGSFSNKYGDESCSQTGNDIFFDEVIDCVSNMPKQINTAILSSRDSLNKTIYCIQHTNLSVNQETDSLCYPIKYPKPIHFTQVSNVIYPVVSAYLVCMNKKTLCAVSRHLKDKTSNCKYDNYISRVYSKIPTPLVEDANTNQHFEEPACYDKSEYHCNNAAISGSVKQITFDKRRKSSTLSSSEPLKHKLQCRKRIRMTKQDCFFPYEIETPSLTVRHSIRPITDSQSVLLPKSQSSPSLSDHVDEIDNNWITGQTDNDVNEEIERDSGGSKWISTNSNDTQQLKTETLERRKVTAWMPVNYMRTVDKTPSLYLDERGMINGIAECLITSLSSLSIPISEIDSSNKSLTNCYSPEPCERLLAYKQTVEIQSNNSDNDPLHHYDLYDSDEYENRIQTTPIAKTDFTDIDNEKQNAPLTDDSVSQTHTKFFNPIEISLGEEKASINNMYVSPPFPYSDCHHQHRHYHSRNLKYSVSQSQTNQLPMLNLQGFNITDSQMRVNRFLDPKHYYCCITFNNKTLVDPSTHKVDSRGETLGVNKQYPYNYQQYVPEIDDCVLFTNATIPSTQIKSKNKHNPTNTEHSYRFPVNIIINSKGNCFSDNRLLLTTKPILYVPEVKKNTHVKKLVPHQSTKAKPIHSVSCKNTNKLIKMSVKVQCDENDIKLTLKQQLLAETPKTLNPTNEVLKQTQKLPATHLSPSLIWRYSNFQQYTQQTDLSDADYKGINSKVKQVSQKQPLVHDTSDIIADTANLSGKKLINSTRSTRKFKSNHENKFHKSKRKIRPGELTIFELEKYGQCSQGVNKKNCQNLKSSEMSGSRKANYITSIDGKINNSQAKSLLNKVKMAGLNSKMKLGNRKRSAKRTNSNLNIVNLLDVAAMDRTCDTENVPAMNLGKLRDKNIRKKSVIPKTNYLQGSNLNNFHTEETMVENRLEKFNCMEHNNNHTIIPQTTKIHSCISYVTFKKDESTDASQYVYNYPVKMIQPETYYLNNRLNTDQKMNIISDQYQTTETAQSYSGEIELGIWCLKVCKHLKMLKGFVTINTGYTVNIPEEIFTCILFHFEVNETWISSTVTGKNASTGMNQVNNLTKCLITLLKPIIYISQQIICFNDNMKMKGIIHANNFSLMDMTAKANIIKCSQDKYLSDTHFIILNEITFSKSNVTIIKATTSKPATKGCRKNGNKLQGVKILFKNMMNFRTKTKHHVSCGTKNLQAFSFALNHYYYAIEEVIIFEMDMICSSEYCSEMHCCLYQLIITSIELNVCITNQKVHKYKLYHQKSREVKEDILKSNKNEHNEMEYNHRNAVPSYFNKWSNLLSEFHGMYIERYCTNSVCYHLYTNEVNSNVKVNNLDCVEVLLEQSSSTTSVYFDIESNTMKEKVKTFTTKGKSIKMLNVTEYPVLFNKSTQTMSKNNHYNVTSQNASPHCSTDNYNNFGDKNELSDKTVLLSSERKRSRSLNLSVEFSTSISRSISATEITRDESVQSVCFSHSFDNTIQTTSVLMSDTTSNKTNRSNSYNYQHFNDDSYSDDARKRLTALRTSKQKDTNRKDGEVSQTSDYHSDIRTYGIEKETPLYNELIHDSSKVINMKSSVTTKKCSESLLGHKQQKPKNSEHLDYNEITKGNCEQPKAFGEVTTNSPKIVYIDVDSANLSAE
uniref:Uncharacterized protein n=1 Tax=Trichobilharzia regenti TaxID=157069 RepID=A0AA85JRR6_TRIRE|nr:unnamed protein product [Trichobilharzia regenti]